MMTSTSWARVADQIMVILILVIMLNSDVCLDQKKIENVRYIRPLVPYSLLGH